MFAIAIDRTASTPLSEQIAAEMRRRISQGELAVGLKLPASRRFAKDLGVARATVVMVYEQLAAEGYLTSKRGAGTYVCAAPTGLRSSRIQKRTTTPSPPPSSTLFAPGAPDMRLFPYAVWGRSAARALRLWPERSVVAEDPFGDIELRGAIAEHLAQWRGISAEPRQIVVTAGSGNGLEICVAALSRAERTIALENPGYPPLRSFARSLGLSVENLAVGPEGAEIPAPGAGLAVITPSHQYPLGGAMPLKRRVEFLDWADAADAWIIEDDYDSEFRYSGAPIPALMGLATSNRADSGRVIYSGSFSKVFSNELRLGFLVLPERLVDGAAAALFAEGAKASLMPQRALARFMLEGHFHKHIRRVRRVYGERRVALIDALGPQLAESIVNSAHKAGMHLALLLDAAVERDALAQALGQGLAPRSLSACAEGTGVAGLRIGFCAHTPEEIAAHGAVLRRCTEGALASV